MAQSTRVKERQAAQALRIKQAQAFMVPDNIDVAILGGGAAGLCAAITAAEALGANKRVVVFEKALESGRTILATGGGRCNFTNADLSFENFSHPEFVQAVCRDKDVYKRQVYTPPLRQRRSLEQQQVRLRQQQWKASWRYRHLPHPVQPSS